MDRLTGQALIDYVRSCEGQDRDKIIEGAGYYVERDGKRSPTRTKFFEALTAAQGLKLGDPVKAGSTSARAKYRIKVGVNGLIPVSAAYTRQAGLTPGSYAAVEIDNGAIVLYPEAPEKTQAESCQAPQLNQIHTIPVRQEDAMSAMIAA